MAIGSVDGPSGVRRLRRKRRGQSADSASEARPAEGVEAAAPAAPIPPLDPLPQDGPPVISAQMMGQSNPAEGADPANSAARQARSAYLKVEWSGRYDRRAGRGRITKTEV
jgi:hypothetical protein